MNTSSRYKIVDDVVVSEEGVQYDLKSKSLSSKSTRSKGFHGYEQGVVDDALELQAILRENKKKEVESIIERLVAAGIGIVTNQNRRDDTNQRSQVDAEFEFSMKRAKELFAADIATNQKIQDANDKQDDLPLLEGLGMVPEFKGSRATGEVLISPGTPPEGGISLTSPLETMKKLLFPEIVEELELPDYQGWSRSIPSRKDTYK
jgi:hypothetical protein